MTYKGSIYVPQWSNGLDFEGKGRKKGNIAGYWLIWWGFSCTNNYFSNVTSIYIIA